MAKTEDTYEVIGMRSVDFKSREGDQVSGITVYLVQDFEKGKGLGKKTESFFMTKEKLSDSVASAGMADAGAFLGQIVQLYYNKYGKVASFELVN